jgi:hypothetical protein
VSLPTVPENFDRVDKVERTLWATRGCQRGAFPLRCALSETRMREAMEQGWPLIRVVDPIGVIIGAGAAIRVMLPPQRGQDPLHESVDAWGTVERIPLEERLHVATLFECDEETVLSVRYRLDLPSTKVRYIDVGDMMVKGKHYLIAFDGPFVAGTFSDDVK